MSEELKPCPFCGSKNIEDDYDSVRTTFTGTKENPTGFHEYQTGWVDCKECLATGPEIRAKDDEIDNVGDMTRKAWNTRQMNEH